MKNLFEPVLAETIKQRIMRVNADHSPLWGGMTLAQTLAHCNSGIQMAIGVINPKRASFPANMIGPLIKPIVFGDDKQMRRNSPSSPELFSVLPTDSNFERERTQLITAIDNFVNQGPACCSRHPHPFFGFLKPEQWGILMYKHLDHHLRQFGV